MPRNGSGSYALPAGNPVVTGTVISSTVQNNTTSDIATALTQSLAYDGQTIPITNLPMGTYRHTGVGNAVNLTDYAATGQVQNGGFNWCGTAGGTKNALTLSPPIAVTAYAAGQRFYFKSGAAASDSTVTVAVSGLTAIAVQTNGAAMSSTVTIEISKWYEIVLDSTSTCQLNKIGPDALSNLGISAFAQTILDDVDAATVRTTIGANATLPSQTGNSGKALVSNGTIESWGYPAQLSTAAGSAPSYGARAWVRFAGGAATIYGSGNVSSITRSGAGDYTVNFTTAMADTLYAAIPGKNNQTTNSNTNVTASTYATGSVKVGTFEGGAGTDCDNISLVVFR